MVYETQKLVSEYWESANPENKALREEYLETCGHLSPESIKQYESGLRIWISYLNKYCDNIHVTEVEPIQFVRYLGWLAKNGVKTSALKVKRSAVNNLNNHIMTFHRKKFNTFINFVTKSIKTPEFPRVHEKEPLTEEEYKLIIDTLIERGTHWDIQKLAYLVFTYISGCRRAESAQLLKEVVDYKPIEKMAKFRDKDGVEVTAKAIKYRSNPIKCKGKITDEPRRLSFDQNTMDILKKWLEIRGEDNCPFMFIAGRGDKARKIDKQAFNAWCKQFEKIIGRRMHPHNLRMARATHLSEHANIESIQALLGHKNPLTTKIYIIRDEDDNEDEIFV